MLERNSKIWNEDLPREKSLNIVTNSFKMIQLADCAGSGNSVVMGTVTE